MNRYLTHEVLRAIRRRGECDALAVAGELAALLGDVQAEIDALVAEGRVERRERDGIVTFASK